MEITEQSQTKLTKNKNTITLVGKILITILLILSLAWLYVEVGRLKLPDDLQNIITIDKRVSENTTDIASLEDQVSNNRTEISYLKTDVESNTSRISYLNSDISLHNGQISYLDSYLSEVARLAENANNYAHSHPYSDVRLKEDIEPIKNPLSNILQVHGVSFSWKLDSENEFPEGRQIGIIAQELQTVYPELVKYDEKGLLMVDYSKLTPILIEAIREQQNQITDLEQRITLLETQLNGLNVAEP